MAGPEDLINFDIIETQKENIQSLPQGRSAKALASAFGATPSYSEPTPGSTRSLNEAIRSEYEKEVQNISDCDDPLDVYDRYVKWTLNAYPTAQATPESQLRALLERATKAFQNVTHYKNDPRYLKLWMNYIRFFSDAPRETFAYLSRHGIGEGLALFYEEFAAWLEGAGRWSQAEEVYKLGIEREARPTERLLRKFGEFQSRFEQHPTDANEPSSPALPTVRPALAAKLDPFASTPRAGDPQAQRLPATLHAARSGKPKLAIFSDASAPPPLGQSASDEARGWDSIGSIAERKKENTVEARPWVGETLKAGKRAGAVPKMAVFKDESNAQCDASRSIPRATTNAKTGRVEHVFANLEAVYPDPADLREEYCFEELRARARGWLAKSWTRERASKAVRASDDTTTVLDLQDMTQDLTCADLTSADLTADLTGGGPRKARKERSRPRRKKVMEVKGETQTVKINLDSPTGRKVKRKNSAEPTMTLHTKAANEEMLDIFNAPLGAVATIGEAAADSGDESDYDTDDYTSGGESTCTGHMSAVTSECGDDDASGRGLPEATSEVTEAKSVTAWSDFTRSKHVPALMSDNDLGDGRGDDNGAVVNDAPADEPSETQGSYCTGLEDLPRTEEAPSHNDTTEASEASGSLPSSNEQADSAVPGAFPDDTGSVPDNMGSTPDDVANVDFIMHGGPPPLPIPEPPADWHVPMHPYRDAEQVAQSRLPFMTPIVERTECSIPSVRVAGEPWGAKTPSRLRSTAPGLPQIEDLLLSSPFQEIVNESRPARRVSIDALASEEPAGEEPSALCFGPLDSIARDDSITPDSPITAAGPVISDMQCNPLDPSIRQTILAHAAPQLARLAGYHDARPRASGRAAELRRFARATGSSSGGGGGGSGSKRDTQAETPLRLENAEYLVRRELGQGAFAPVYLASETGADIGAGDSDVAIKAEEPASAWEFHAMSVAHARLGSHRAAASLAKPLALHLYSDESYLIESYHSQGTLLDLSNASGADAATGASPLVDETVAMFFAAELLRAVLALHAHGILHGDVKADNCLVRLDPADDWHAAYHADGSRGWAAKGLALIDFGRATDRTAFPVGARFVADWQPSAHDCPSVRAARPWTVHADLWGVAGCVHLLLFGRWMEDVEAATDEASAERETGEPSVDGVSLHPAAHFAPLAARRSYRPRESFKRYWQTPLWTALFDALMNPPPVTPLSAASSSEAAESDSAAVAALRGLESYLEAHGERRGLKAALRRIEERSRRKR